MNTSTSPADILPPGTVLVVEKGCPIIGWEKGTRVVVKETVPSQAGGLVTFFNTPNGQRGLYPSNGNARGLRALSFNNGNPLRRVVFKRVK